MNHVFNGWDIQTSRGHICGEKQTSRAWLESTKMQKKTKQKHEKKIKRTKENKRKQKVLNISKWNTSELRICKKLFHFFLEIHKENKLCLPVQVLKSLSLLHASMQNPGVKVQQPK